MPTPEVTPSSVAALAPTGTLRVAINLGNPVLAQGTADEPSGVTLDLAREVATRPHETIAFACSTAARTSFGALSGGGADVGILAVEPARAAEVDLTAPYVVIEAVVVVPDASPLTTARQPDVLQQAVHRPNLR